MADDIPLGHYEAKLARMHMPDDAAKVRQLLFWLDEQRVELARAERQRDEAARMLRGIVAFAERLQDTLLPLVVHRNVHFDDEGELEVYYEHRLQCGEFWEARQWLARVEPELPVAKEAAHD
jgi:hypothetical protein